MTRLKNLSLVLVSALAIVFTGCKYEEGPGISFRTKRDRIANEWKVTGYQIDGTEDAAAKKTFISAGDSIELILVMTRNYSYAMDMSYVDGYVSPSGDKLLAPSSLDTRTYRDISNTFATGNSICQKLHKGGKWAFGDKYKSINFGANGNGDLSYQVGKDTAIFKSNIIMLKNDNLKMEFEFGGKKHLISFEPKNKEIIKKD
jgi:hypothetical protein